MCIAVQSLQNRSLHNVFILIYIRITKVLNCQYTFLRSAVMNQFRYYFLFNTPFLPKLTFITNSHNRTISKMFVHILGFLCACIFQNMTIQSVHQSLLYAGIHLCLYKVSEYQRWKADQLKCFKKWSSSLQGIE